MNVANIYVSTTVSILQIIYIFGAGKIANIICHLILISTSFQWEITKIKIADIYYGINFLPSVHLIDYIWKL